MTPHRRFEDVHPKPRRYYMLLFLVWATVLSILLLTTIVGVWTLAPYHPIDQSPQPFPIVYPTDKVVRQGGTLVYQFRYTKHLSDLPIINRQFVDGLVFNVTENTNPTVTKVGSGLARVQVHVPETLPPGTYSLHITATYHPNPLRTYVNDTYTEKFKVVANRDLDLD